MTSHRSCRTASAMILIVAFSGFGCEMPAARDRREKTEKARAQVGRICEELDRQTTETGSYDRVKPDDIKETDPWGTAIKVDYSSGGVAETILVRSAGPDRQFHTPDDVVQHGMTANFKGVGQAVKDNAGEVASDVGKGLVEGAAEGAKEVAKDAAASVKAKARGVKESVKGVIKGKEEPKEPSESENQDQ